MFFFSLNFILIFFIHIFLLCDFLVRHVKLVLIDNTSKNVKKFTDIESYVNISV